MLSPLQELKQTHYFRLVDSDNNGYIEKADWTTIGENLAAIRGLSQDSNEYQGIKNAMTHIWENIRKFADSNNDYRVSLDKWLSFQDEKVINADDDWYDQYVNTFFELLFDLIDENSDEKIDQKEYVGLLVCFRVEPRNALLAFNKIDQNKDGIISKDELIAAIRDFNRSNEADTAGNWLFGPYWKH